MRHSGHERAEVVEAERLEAIRERVVRARVDLDQQAVGAGRDRGERDRRDEIPLARPVRRIGQDGKVRETLEEWDRVHVEGVARVPLERADAALAEDDVAVSACEDVLGRKQELLDRRGHAALQEHWFGLLSDRVEQRIVLHVPRAYLEAVGDGGDGLDIAGRKDLGDDRKPADGTRLGEYFKSLLPHAAKRV